MAKIVSEKRETVARSTPDLNSTQEPKNSPMMAFLGVALTAIFLFGAVAVVVMAFQNT